MLCLIFINLDRIYYFYLLIFLILIIYKIYIYDVTDSTACPTNELIIFLI